MIRVENIEVWGWEHTIRGARNPMDSWAKSDSGYDEAGEFVVGPDDLYLLRRLYRASLQGDNHAHRKYLRQVCVSMDITAPRYWWPEMDTYKVGTTANSCSTMHRIAAKEFTLDDFSHEHLMLTSLTQLQSTIDALNYWRDIYLSGGSSDEDPTGQARRIFEPKDKEAWWQLIQLLPQSYNQKRTLTMNYENVFTMINQRTGHKLDEWNEFVKILRSLPLVNEIREGM